MRDCSYCSSDIQNYRSIEREQYGTSTIQRKKILIPGHSSSNFSTTIPYRTGTKNLIIANNVLQSADTTVSLEHIMRETYGNSSKRLKTVLQ